MNCLRRKVSPTYVKQPIPYYVCIFIFCNRNTAFYTDSKKTLEKRDNVHLVVKSSCICKTLTKTNVNKENHTLDLTKIMQYGLIG